MTATEPLLAKDDSQAQRTPNRADVVNGGDPLFGTPVRSPVRAHHTPLRETPTKEDDAPATTAWLPVILILLSTCMLGIAWMILLGFFSQYALKSKGITQTAIGFIFGTQEITTSLTVPLTAKLSAHGFFVGQFVMALGQLAIVFANNFYGSAFLGLCTVARIISGLGSALLQTGTLAWICKLISNDHRGLVFGLWKTFSGLGMVIGPTLGEALFSNGGFALPFVVCALGLGLMGALAFPYFALDYVRQLRDRWTRGDGYTEIADGEEQQEENRPEPAEKATWCKIIAIPSVWVIGFQNCWQILCFMYIDPTLGPHMQKKFGSSDKTVALVFSVYYGAFAGLAPIAGWIGDRFGNLRTIMVGVPFVALGLIMLDNNYFHPNMDESMFELIALMILAAGSSLSGVPVNTYIVWAAEMSGLEGNNDIAVGFYSFTYSLGAAVGPLLGSAIVEATSFATTSIIFGVGIGVSWLLVLALIWTGHIIDDKTFDEKAGKGKSYGGTKVVV